MAAGRRPDDHRIDEVLLMDQSTIGPLDGLFVAPGLQVRDGEGKLYQVTERIERAQARHTLQRLDCRVIAAREAVHVGAHHWAQSSNEGAIMNLNKRLLEAVSRDSIARQ